MPVAFRTVMRVQVTSCERYRLRVTTWGSGAPPHAVVLPGLSADWRALAPQIRTLRRLGWSVHVIDLPGFALQPSLRAADANVVQLADYVAKVIETLAIPRALVLGHSLGGGVALHLALRRPELVIGLVLIAPAALGVSLHWIYKLYCVPLLGRLLLRPSVLRASTIRQFLVGSGRRSDVRFVARLVRHGISARPRALSARAIIWANQPRRWRKARAHRRETLQGAAACGRADRPRRRPLAAPRSGGLGERAHRAFPRVPDRDHIASRLT
ncbi:MAG: alpha/beta fold hydrolase [Chloroflexi bacterium]|nr:MAG: alpha/beta fold hydrolase [Chloroflexota bacterium]